VNAPKLQVVTSTTRDASLDRDLLSSLPSVRGFGVMSVNEALILSANAAAVELLAVHTEAEVLGRRPGRARSALPS